MRNIYIVAVALLLSLNSWAQAPQKMSYQAVIRNTSNALITSSPVGMKISILQGSSSGSVVYSETQTTNTNANGLVSIEIGNGTVVTGTFAAINWANGPYFIKTETDPTGGTAYTIAGTSELLSVPYALHAKTAESITGGITETDPIFVASPANGISSSDINNWNNKLSTEVDGSVTNELQTLSISNDTVYLSNGGYAKLPAGFDGNYNNLTNKPTNVSTFTNDAGYLTSFTEVDGSITNELQTLSIGHDTIYLSNGGYTKLPAGFDGNYNSLTNKPTAVSSFSNDAGYLTSFTEVDGSITNELQTLSIGHDTIYLSNGGYTKLPAGFDGNYNSLTNKPTAVSSFSNDAGYLTSFTEVDGSITNELQTIRISNDTIYLSNGGFAKLPATNAWGLNGNSGTDATNNFIGTTDNQDIVFKTNNTERMHIFSDGKMRVGGNINAGLTYPLEIQVPSTTGSQFNLKLTNLLNPANNSGSGVGLLFAPDDAAIAKMGIFVERKGPWGVGTMHFLSRTSGDFASADLSNSVMAITQNGNVGIGTTTPAEKLVVQGNHTDGRIATFQNIYDEKYITMGQVVTDDGGYIKYKKTSNYTGIGVHGHTEQLVVKGTGAVGIGTTNPLYSLDIFGVAGSPTAATLRVKGGNGSNGRILLADQDLTHGVTDWIATDVFGNITANSSFGGLALQGYSGSSSESGVEISAIIGSADPNDSKAAVQISSHKKNGTTAQSLGATETLFGIRNGFSATNNFVVLGNGNVGIGTINPMKNLHVTTISDDWGARIDGFNTGGSAKGGVVIGSRADNKGAINGITSTSGPADLSINSEGGNVGIGTTSPTTKLHVAGNAKFGATGQINIWEWDNIEKIGIDYNTVNGDFNMRNPVAGKRLLGTISATGSWGVETTSGAELVRITGAGNMGIGNTSPTAKLQVETYGFSNKTIFGINSMLIQSQTPSSRTLFALAPNGTQNADLVIFHNSDYTTNYEHLALGYENTLDNFIIGTGKGGSGLARRLVMDATGSGSSSWKQFVLATNGNVGIGTLTPSAALEVNGSIKVTGGTSSQFLKADGSLDNNTYLTAIVEVADEFSATVAQTSFTLTQTPSTNSKVKMYINGVRISNTAYSVSGTTLTYVPANNGSYVLSANDRIQFDYSY